VATCSPRPVSLLAVKLDRADFDAETEFKAHPRRRVQRRDAYRVLEIGRLDDEERADDLFCLGERAVDEHRTGPARSQCRGRAVLERRDRSQPAAILQLFIVRPAFRHELVALALGQLVERRRIVVTETQKSLHKPLVVVPDRSGAHRWPATAGPYGMFQVSSCQRRTNGWRFDSGAWSAAG